MGTEPDGQPPEPPPPSQEETPPPFEPDYELVTVLERGRSPDGERAFQRRVREGQGQRSG
ncbi:MAG: hypothetical protein ACRDH7_13210 [Actinomycetota bacterium]